MVKNIPPKKLDAFNFYKIILFFVYFPLLMSLFFSSFSDSYNDVFQLVATNDFRQWQGGTLKLTGLVFTAVGHTHTHTLYLYFR